MLPKTLEAQSGNLPVIGVHIITHEELRRMKVGEPNNRLLSFWLGCLTALVGLIPSLWVIDPKTNLKHYTAVVMMAGIAAALFLVFFIQYLGRRKDAVGVFKEVEDRHPVSEGAAEGKIKQKQYKATS